MIVWSQLWSDDHTYGWLGSEGLEYMGHLVCSLVFTRKGFGRGCWGVRGNEEGGGDEYCIG